MNVTVIERPISVLGSRDIADRVLCASDQREAVRAAYPGCAMRHNRRQRATFCA